LNELDIDIVKWFLAETVKSAAWDGRFSRLTKEWANNYVCPVPEMVNEDGKKYGQISDSIVHRSHINQLIEVMINKPPSAST